MKRKAFDIIIQRMRDLAQELLKEASHATTITVCRMTNCIDAIEELVDETASRTT